MNDTSSPNNWILQYALWLLVPALCLLGALSASLLGIVVVVLSAGFLGVVAYGFWQLVSQR